MAKKITARDLASGAAPDAKPLDWKSLALSISATVALLVALALGGQGLGLIKRAWDMASLDAQARRVVADAEAEVARRRGELAQAVLDATVLEAYRSGDSDALSEAQRALSRRLPDSRGVQVVYGADVMAAIGQQMAQFGFARTELLLQAQRTGNAPPAQVHLEDGQQRSLALAQPVIDGEQVVGYVLARFPIDPLLAALRSPGSGAVIELRQSASTSRLSYPVAREGAGVALDDPELVVLPIRDSTLAVAYGTMPPFLIVPLQNPWLLAVLALLALTTAGLLFQARRDPRIVDFLTKRVIKSKPAEEGPTLAEALGQTAKPVAAAEPAPRTAQAPGAARAAAATPAASAPAAVAPVLLDRSIFRAYDIRGVVGKTLTGEAVRLIGRAIGSELAARNLKEICVGRDGRLSGPELAQQLIVGLQEAGAEVIDLGMVPTPVLYYATHELRTGSGVMLTGSHNPPEYNGLKIVLGGQTLAEDQIQGLYQRIAEGRLANGAGSVQSVDVLETYVDRIAGDIQVERPLKVVIDCGNGVAGAIAQKLFEAIGCEVIPLYCEVDGHFPNHHPDPSDLHNLRDLIVSVKQIKADLGLAFDGDGDRLGVVTDQGEVIFPDRLLMLFAQDILERNPGASIIYDVKCTGHLANVVLAHGGVPLMWKTGHSLIKAKMKETQAELAGEMSGHFFFKERWYGFDDGLYAGCRLLEILASRGESASEVFQQLPNSVSTPELKVPMQEGEHYRFVEKFRARARFDGARVTTIDGVRADWEDGWGLVRCSNTTPCLVLRFDANDDLALQRIKQVFKQQLLSVEAKLALPF